MSKKIVFTSAKVNANNSVLEQDKDGYYLVTLGAFNAFNSNGDFYLEDGVTELLTNQSHSLARRLKSGYLKGEVGHPVYQMGMSKADFFARNLRIEQTNTSHHIREIILTPTNIPAGLTGKGTIIMVEGWITPSGPMGDALKKDLDNPNVNVAFSIRSFTSDDNSSGVNLKKLLQIVTWDWVLEPGIKLANKFDKLSIESNDVCIFDIDELISGNGNVSNCFNCSLESNDEKEMAAELIKEIGLNNKELSVLKKW